jgi:hypothetical protein
LSTETINLLAISSPSSCVEKINDAAGMRLKILNECGIDVEVTNFIRILVQRSSHRQGSTERILKQVLTLDAVVNDPEKLEAVSEYVFKKKVSGRAIEKAVKYLTARNQIPTIGKVKRSLGYTYQRSLKTEGETFKIPSHAKADRIEAMSMENEEEDAIGIDDGLKDGGAFEHAEWINFEILKKIFVHQISATKVKKDKAKDKENNDKKDVLSDILSGLVMEVFCMQKEVEAVQSLPLFLSSI